MVGLLWYELVSFSRSIIWCVLTTLYLLTIKPSSLNLLWGVRHKLKKGEPFSVIRKEEGNGSSAYVALSLYFDWASEYIEGLQSEVKSSEVEHELSASVLWLRVQRGRY